MQQAVGGWAFVDTTRPPSAIVELPAAVLWRRAVRMLGGQAARSAAQTDGDPELVTAVLDLRAAIVRDEPADAAGRGVSGGAP